MTDRPWLASSATLRWMSALAPTSMPRVGSSRMISSGAVASQRASSTFCWLPPERLPTRALGSAGRTPSASMYSVTTASLLRAPQLAEPAAPGLDAEHDVLADREVGDDALGVPVLRRERDAVADRVPRGGDPRRLAVDLDLAGVGPVGAVEQPDQLGPPGAEQPGDPDDLAVEDVEVGRLQHAAPAHARSRAAPASPERSMSRARRAPRSPRARRVARPTIFVTRSPRGRSLARVLADQLAVAEHRDPVGDLVDLLEEVADEQDGHALVAQVADHGEQPVHLVAVEARGRLVQDQHPGVEDHRPADRDQLLHRDRVAGQQRVGVEVQPEALQVAGRLAVGGLPVDAAAAAHLVAEHHVLADREVRCRG